MAAHRGGAKRRLSAGDARHSRPTGEQGGRTNPRFHDFAELAKQHPGQISGDQQQRVGLAPALVCGDELTLFDEPLPNVDAKVREHLRLELLAMQRELGFTALYVTHDQEKAIALASHIAVITQGRVALLGTPQDVYLRPRTHDAARCVGSANQMEVTLRFQSGPVVDTCLRPVAVLQDNVHARGTDVAVVSRPERWSMTLGASADRLVLDGHVLAAAFVASHNEYLVDVGGTRLLIWSFGQTNMPTGAAVCCTTPRGGLLFLDRDHPPRVHTFCPGPYPVGSPPCCRWR